jgi:hypothetical protein
MFAFSRIRRYFWLRRLCRLVRPAKLDTATLQKLPDEHLFATLCVAERVKQFQNPQMLSLAIAVAARRAHAAGSFFCATDVKVKTTLSAIQRQIDQERAARAAAAAEAAKEARAAKAAAEAAALENTFAHIFGAPEADQEDYRSFRSSAPYECSAVQGSRLAP